MPRKKAFEMWYVKTKGSKYVLCKNEENLNKVISKAGKDLSTVRHLKRTKVKERLQLVSYVRTREYNKYKRRAKELGFQSLSQYVKFLLAIDSTHKILETDHDYIGTSPYQFQQPTIDNIL